MNSLHQTIQTLASEFATGVLDIIKSGSLDDLLGESKANGAHAPQRAAKSVGSKTSSKGGRLVRRSVEDIDAMAGRIVQIVRSAGKEGMRAEVLREKLGIDRKELPRPLAQALGAGWLKTTGQKRATTYFVGNAKASKKSGTKKSKRTTPKKTKRASKKTKRAATKKTKRAVATVAAAVAAGAKKE